MKNRLYAGAAASALLISISAGTAIAQQAPQPNAEGEIVLEPIVVQGDRGTNGAAGGEGESDNTVVATQQQTVLTTRVTREGLEAQQITDFNDVARLTPGVSFSDSTGSFNVRGLDRMRVLTTIDGIRVPWINDGARGVQGGISTFDFDSLSQIDLVKSSDSTVFGSGALGGVVALRTIDPEDLIEPGRNWGSLTKSGFDSRDNSWRVDEAAAARVGGTFFMVQGGYRNGDETDNKGSNNIVGPTRTTPEPADYDQSNLLVKLKQHVGGGHVFGFTGERFVRDEDIDDRTASPTTYEPGVTREKISKRERVSASYTYDGGGFVDAANAILYWQRQQLDNNFEGVRRTPTPPSFPFPFGEYTRYSSRDESTFGINGSLLKLFETGAVRHAISFGGEVYGSKASQYSAGVDNCPDFASSFPPCAFLHTNQADMPDVDGTTVGIFAQDEISFLGGRARLTPAIRYDWYEQKPQETAGLDDNPTFDGVLPDASSGDRFSGKLRLEYDTSEVVTVYAQWAQAFRAPTATELYLTYGGPNTYLSVGNPDLQPETSNGFDVGAIIGDDDLGGTVSAFYNRYKNYIDEISRPGFDPNFPMGITDQINRPNVEIYGAELSAHYRDVSGWHGWGKFGAYFGEDIDRNEGLNTILATKVILGVGYAADEWGTDAIFTAAAARDLDDVENLNSTTPSYQVVDLTAWWSPRQFKGLTLRAGVFNIFDEKYFEDALDLADSVQNKDFYTEPGRNLRISATYKF